MTISGNVAVVCVDMQGGIIDPSSQFYNPGYNEMLVRGRCLLDYCREINVPICFLQEVHRESGMDFGRELEGDENVHCIETNPFTAVAEDILGRNPEKEPLIPKRRYSGFLYTDLEVVLSGFGIHPHDILILIGGFTDVCVHYTFVDAHQRDYRLRVVTDILEGSSERASAAALEAMHYLQHDALVTLDEVLAELEEWHGNHPAGVSSPERDARYVAKLAAYRSSHELTHRS